MFNLQCRKVPNFEFDFFCMSERMDNDPLFAGRFVAVNRFFLELGRLFTRIV